MTIQQFIEAAEQGGFSIIGGADCYTKIEEYLLNPLAWKAVVKKEFPTLVDSAGYQTISDISKTRMHNMINALFSGLTLEDFLQTL